MLCHQRYSTASFHLHQSRINSTNSQAPMKNNKVHQSFVRHTVPSRLDRANITLPIFAFIAVFAGWLLAGTVAHAQTPVLRFSFGHGPHHRHEHPERGCCPDQFQRSRRCHRFTRTGRFRSVGPARQQPRIDVYKCVLCDKWWC